MDPLYWHTSNIFVTVYVYVYLRRYWLCLLGCSSRQPLWHNIVCICLFARENTKVNDPISWKCISMVWFSVSGVLFICRNWLWHTMVRFRGVGKVRIISIHQFTSEGLYSPWSTFYNRWMHFIGLHYKAWNSQDIFLFNFDCRIYLGWLEGE